MIDTPRIVKTESQRSAIIRLTVPRADIQKVMGPAMGEVMAAVAAQGIKPAGPVFTHHFRMPSETCDFEVGVPVGSATVKATGRVQPGTLPAATLARTIYRGGYGGLGSGWSEFGSWITAHGHAVAPEFWESYLKGPESGPDSTKWETELSRPIAAKA